MEKGRANAALEQITATMRGATTQRGEMTSLKANTEHESAELARRKVIISSSLVRFNELTGELEDRVKATRSRCSCRE